MGTKDIELDIFHKDNRSIISKLLNKEKPLEVAIGETISDAIKAAALEGKIIIIQKLSVNISINTASGTEVNIANPEGIVQDHVDHKG